MSPRAWYRFRRALLAGNLLTPLPAAGLFLLGHPFLGLGLWIPFYAALHWAVFVPRCSWLGPVVSSFTPASGDEVWITIDDGPDPADTPALLDLLKARNAKATFFFIGSRAEQHPALVRRAAEEGHGIGHHTFSHPAHALWMYPPGAVSREVSRGRRAVAQAAGRTGGPMPFRAPVGHKNLFLHGILEAGDPVVAWSARAFDTVWHDPDKVARRLLKNTQAGAIILMHEGVEAFDGSRQAPRVLSGLLDGLERRGLRAVLPDVSG